jgi:uncharacterized protein
LTDSAEPFEIRDPIHGFIRLSQLERDVVNHPILQRLRRIKQLAWTDMVYPGATHSRFEHSLGVMHVATRLFEALVRRSGDILEREYGYVDGGLRRQRRIIRLAALLHDVGHGPFSHAAEELLPVDDHSGERFVHEDYSEAAIKGHLSDLINGHREARTNGIRVEDILAVFAAVATSSGDLVWKDLVSGQMDADRMDYLLRDAFHAGVQYGRFDLDRVANTLRLCPDPETGGHHVGVEEDGIHAVEGLLIARFMMFTQLYFHKTRTIYDYHLVECLKELLKANSGSFPPPTSIDEFLKWDDWRVLGMIAEGLGGEHAQVLRDRRHFRLVYMTPEVMGEGDFERADRISDGLQALGCVVRDAEKSWYKSGADEIKVWRTSGGVARSVPLAELSPVVKGLTKVNQRRLYVPPQNREAAAKIVAQLAGAPQ